MPLYTTRKLHLPYLIAWEMHWKRCRCVCESQNVCPTAKRTTEIFWIVFCIKLLQCELLLKTETYKILFINLSLSSSNDQADAPTVTWLEDKLKKPTLFISKKYLLPSNSAALTSLVWTKLITGLIDARSLGARHVLSHAGSHLSHALSHCTATTGWRNVWEHFIKTMIIKLLT